MLNDLQFGCRRLIRQPAFSITAIVTIALGIGLGSTVFAVVDGVLFRPLPYRDAGRLLAVYGAVRAESQWTMPVSYPDLVDWRRASSAFAALEGYDMSGPQARLRGADETTQVPSGAVTNGFVAMLGVDAAVGRSFLPEDFTAGAAPVALISHRVWRGAFAADPDVLGRTIERGSRTHTIIGVMPESFVFPTPPRRFAPEVLVPFDATSRTATDRGGRFLYLIGRLTSDASLPQAQSELDAIAIRLQPLFPARPNRRPGAFDGVTLMDLRDQLTRASRSALWLVFGAAVSVFLIACANVVGLLLAQAEDRRRELAIRTAIGAARWHLMRQLVLEASLLAAAGGAGGWLVSVVTFDALLAQIPRWLQLLGDPRLGGRAAAFAAIMAVVTVVVAGVLPAIRSSAEAPRAALAGGGRSGTGRHRTRHVLLLVQVALATLLVCASGIMLRSWVILTAQDSGMDAARVIAVRGVPSVSADSSRRSQFNDRLAAAIRRVPGVEAVAFVDMPLLQSAIKGSSFIPPSRAAANGGFETDLQVTPDYFATVGIPIRLGRALNDADRGRGVVISETLARRYWPGRSPIGESVRYGDETREIVGVAADARDVAFDRPPTPTLYHAWDDREPPLATIVARFNGKESIVIAGIRAAVREAEPSAAITMLSTVEDLLSVSVAPRSFNTLLFVVFGAAGWLVAVVGIYGLVSFIVVRQEREMGIRLALGATGSRLKFDVLSSILRWVGAGVAFGVAVATLSAQYLKPLVYQIPPNDVWTMSLVAVAFVLVGGGASYLPARRAARLDPLMAFRAE